MKKNILVEDLQLCYDYFVKMMSGEVCGGVTDGFNDRFFDANFSFVDTFYSFLINLREFNNFPIVVSDDLYENINGQQLYHGYKDFDHGCEMMSEKIYNLGTGNTTPGMFFSSSRDEAEFYTAGQNVSAYDFTPPDKERVLKLKVFGHRVPDQTKFFLRLYQVKCTEKYIDCLENPEDRIKIQILHDFTKTLPSDHSEKFYNLFRQNIGICTAYLGYDYIFEGGMVYILTNRKSIIIPISEAKRFFDNSKKYNGKFDKRINVIDDINKIIGEKYER